MSIVHRVHNQTSLALNKQSFQSVLYWLPDVHDVHAVIPEFQANAQHKIFPNQKVECFPLIQLSRPRTTLMLNHHNAIYTMSPKKKNE